MLQKCPAHNSCSAKRGSVQWTSARESAERRLGLGQHPLGEVALSWRERLRIVREAVGALAYLHGQNVAQRDLKRSSNECSITER